MSRTVPLFLALLSFPLFGAQRIPGPEHMASAPLPSPAGGAQVLTGAAAHGEDFVIAWTNRTGYYASRVAPGRTRLDSPPVRLNIGGSPALASVGGDLLVAWWGWPSPEKRSSRSPETAASR
jgi:hypothetical protein